MENEDSTPAVAEPSSEDAYALVKAGGDDGWKLVWEHVVEPEMRSTRSAELARKYGVTAGDLMGWLYEDMIGRKKIDNFRNDGGSLWGWMRQYARGYVTRANPAAHGEFSLEATAERDERGEMMPILVEAGKGIRHNEVWYVTHRCFLALWDDDPVKAYVHILRAKLRLSSEQVKEMLNLSSAAAVDQIFSRAVRDMRAYWVEYDRKGTIG